jgi:hypothetical protein
VSIRVESVALAAANPTRHPPNADARYTTLSASWYTEGLSLMAHTTLVVHRPDISKWQAWCERCEDIGVPLSTESEAWDVAEAHQAGSGVSE